MRALRITAPFTAVVGELPPPVLTPTGVLVRARRTAISTGTEIRQYRDERVAQTQALARRIADIMATRDRDAWGAAFDAAGIPWGPVNTLAETASDPHFRARGLFRSVGGSDGGTRWHVAQPLVFSGERPGPRRDAPRLGEHTEEILAPLAGTSTNG